MERALEQKIGIRKYAGEFTMYIRKLAIYTWKRNTLLCWQPFAAFALQHLIVIANETDWNKQFLVSYSQEIVWE